MLNSISLNCWIISKNLTRCLKESTALLTTISGWSRRRAAKIYVGFRSCLKESKDSLDSKSSKLVASRIVLLEDSLQ